MRENAVVHLAWQSKLVLLLVVPAVVATVLIDTQWWISQTPTDLRAQALHVLFWTIGISILFGLVVYTLKAATALAAATGAFISACLMFGTLVFPFEWWRTALMPLLCVFVLSYLATRVGRARKERLGTAESSRGRNAGQVAANLGVAAIASIPPIAGSLDRIRPNSGSHSLALHFAPAIAALAEAAADTVSSELGQLLAGRPRLITTLAPASPGTDGAISLPGTLAGAGAAAVIVFAAHITLSLTTRASVAAWLGAVVGFLFDSLLGTTLEFSETRRQRNWLINDAVNFLSTLVAALVAAALVVL